MKYQVSFKSVSEWIKRITNSWTETSTGDIVKKQTSSQDIEHPVITVAKKKDIALKAGNTHMHVLSDSDYCSTY
jgi:hypothetical protein